MKTRIIFGNRSFRKQTLRRARKGDFELAVIGNRKNGYNLCARRGESLVVLLHFNLQKEAIAKGLEFGHKPSIVNLKKVA